MRFCFKSDKGIVRAINEDSCNVLAGYPRVPVTFIIADGMGGHNSGEIASRTAVDFVSNYILQYPEKLTGAEDLSFVIQEIMEEANKAVYAQSKEQEQNSGMGTTLIIAVAWNKKLHIGHIGDSRVYLIRRGEMERITTDHSYIEELLRTGSLTKEQAEKHPNKNIITRAIGCSENIEVDTYTCNIKDNDIFLLCTDGLTNMVGEDEIEQVLEDNDDPERACEKLISRANENGGEDNISVIVFKND